MMHTVNKAYNLPNPPPSLQEKIIKSIEKTLEWLRKLFTKRKQEPARQPTLESQNHSSSEDRHPWTIVHGFYAVMGGIAFEIPENLPESERFLPSRTVESSFVNHDWIRSLLEKDVRHELIPNLSGEEIKSKSKANNLAKALVSIQVLWFIAQCFTRLAQHVPISLLELNTFGHAVCALLIYLLWWEKPFEVDYPTMIKAQILWDMCALHWMRHTQTLTVDTFVRNLRADQWFRTLSEIQQRKNLKHWTEESLFDYTEVLRGDDEDPDDYESRLMRDIERDRDNEASSTILTPGQILQGTAFRVIDLKGIAVRCNLSSSFHSYNGSHLPLPDISLTTETAIRYKMAWRAIRYLTRLKQTQSEWEIMPGALFQRYYDSAQIDNVGLPIAIGFVAVGLIYGGLHALAWFAHFVSPTEQLLWRISACMVMGGLPACLVLSDLVDIVLGMETLFERKTFLRYKDLRVRCPRLEYLLLWPQVVLLVSILLAYILARGYLVVECFINLSHLPAGVYDIPNWAVYFPHIS
ncbi:hypothetical protein MMC22_011268 [Lobaria immixta]|nr:hypothetical protein [Lobaria immixta]